MAASHSRGYSGLEILMAIVILGIVFLMTLKGIAVIPSMRAFILSKQIQEIQFAVQQYQTDYGNLPGDDPGVTRRWAQPPPVFYVGTRMLSLVGDGKIQGLLDDPANASGEQYTAWRDLRLAGLVPGDANLSGQSSRPETPHGGFIGFAEDNLGIMQALCLTMVPGADAYWLDKRLDDGGPGTGKLRGTSQWNPSAGNHFSEPDIDDYNPEKTYIICLPALP